MNRRNIGARSQKRFPPVIQKTPAFRNESPPVYSSAKSRWGELAEEDALRALRERAVVPRHPAMVELRCDECRSTDQADDGNELVRSTRVYRSKRPRLASV